MVLADNTVKLRHCHNLSHDASIKHFMKTIILYATKYGASGEAARRIAEKIDGAVACNLKQDSIPPLDGFDCIIFGSSLYAGMIRREAKAFLSKNSACLQGKKLGLFLCGLGADGADGFFKKNFPAELLQAAKAKGFFGGIFDPKKTGALERLILRIVTKQSAYMNTISDRRIEQFVNDMKA